MISPNTIKLLCTWGFTATSENCKPEAFIGSVVIIVKRHIVTFPCSHVDNPVIEFPVYFLARTKRLPVGHGRMCLGVALGNSPENVIVGSWADFRID